MNFERSKIIYLLLACVVLIWGVNYSLLKWALQEMDPLPFNAIRYTWGSILIFSLLLAREGWSPPQKKDLIKLLGLGLLGHALYQILFIKGIDLTTAGNTALILATIPVWTAIISVMMKKEELSKLAWIGIFLTLGGVFFITLGSGKKLALTGSATVGNLLVSLGAIAWAIYSILSQDLLRRNSPLALTSWAMLAGSACLWLFAGPDLPRQAWSTISLKTWAILFFSGTFSIVLAYVVWAAGIRALGASKTAIFSNATPIVSMIAALLLLGEPIGWLQGIGSAAIIYGVALTARN